MARSPPPIGSHPTPGVPPSLTERALKCVCRSGNPEPVIPAMGAGRCCTEEMCPGIESNRRGAHGVGAAMQRLAQPVKHARMREHVG